MSDVQYGLFDGTCQGQKSMTLAGDRKDEGPKHIEWVRDEYLPITFFTDMCLDKALYAPKGVRCFAWLLEPEAFADGHYAKAVEYGDRVFEAIFTHDLRFSYMYEPFYYVPFGGSWVKPLEAPPEKTKDICMFYSGKKRTIGHKIRTAFMRSIVEDPELCNLVDIYGNGVSNYVPSKSILKDYRYCIVVETTNTPGYFSEKLLDCYAMYTDVLYWGWTDNYGDMDYPITSHGNWMTYPIQTTKKLRKAILKIDWIGEWMSGLIHGDMNEWRAKRIKDMFQYACAEDWLYDRFQRLLQK